MAALSTEKGTKLTSLNASQSNKKERRSPNQFTKKSDRVLPKFCSFSHFDDVADDECSSEVILKVGSADLIGFG